MLLVPVAFDDNTTSIVIMDATEAYPHKELGTIGYSWDFLQHNFVKYVANDAFKFEIDKVRKSKGGKQ